MKYTVEWDSHYRVFLKEEGYGYIAQLRITQEGTHIQPLNKGVDMADADLADAALRGLNNLADKQEKESARLWEWFTSLEGT